MDWGCAVYIGDLPRGEVAEIARPADVQGPFGTPVYMPPELAVGDGPGIGKHTDNYLLGAILYEIVAGKPPHVRNNYFAGLLAAAQGDLPPDIGELPSGMQAIVEKALAGRPEDRYQSAGAIRVAIEHWLGHRESQRLAEAQVEREGIGSASSRSRKALCPAYTLHGEALELWQEARRARQRQRTAGWAAARGAIVRRDEHRCRVCGSTEDLEVHHIVQWDFCRCHEADNLITLCADCHRGVHRGFRPDDRRLGGPPPGLAGSSPRAGQPSRSPISSSSPSSRSKRKRPPSPVAQIGYSIAWSSLGFLLAVGLMRGGW